MNRLFSVQNTLHSKVYLDQPENPTDMEELFQSYQESHQNPANQRMHYLCVPLIVFSITGLLYLVQLPPIEAHWFNLSLVLVGLSSLYYLRFSLKVFLIMGLYYCLNFFLIFSWYAVYPETVLWTSMWIFILAWIGQFVGHKWEGKKPSFLQDIFFLLIGPAWVLQKILVRFHLNLL